jgi:hypothetical protein
MRLGVTLGTGLAAVVAMAGLATGEADWEYWSQYEAAWKVEESLDVRLKPELRFRDDFAGHYYWHLEIGADWKAQTWLVLGPYYRHIRTESGRDWKTEKRPHANATLAWSLGSIALSDRNRLEYRIKTGKEAFVYRNRLWVKFPHMGPAGFQPFLGNEVFYDFDAEEINRNRAYAGFTIKLASGANADLYYILDSSKKNDEWSPTNILATALKYKF